MIQNRISQSSKILKSTSAPSLRHASPDLSRRDKPLRYDKAVDGTKSSHSGNKIEHSCVVANYQLELQHQHGIRNAPFQHLRKLDCTSLLFASTGREGRHKIDPHEQSSFMSISGDYFILQDMGPSAEKNLRSTMTKYQGNTI